MQRRLAEGLSKKDILRCLKRFIARKVFNDLKPTSDSLDIYRTIGEAQADQSFWY